MSSPYLELSKEIVRLEDRIANLEKRIDELEKFLRSIKEELTLKESKTVTESSPDKDKAIDAVLLTWRRYKSRKGLV